MIFLRPHKGRECPPGLRVFAYYNLHSGLWSLKALEGPDKGRVVAHATAVTLYRVTPRVSEKGRQRVLREKQKNVHAGLVGLVGVACGLLMSPTREITYNPYKGPCFTFKSTGEPYSGSQAVYLTHNRRCYAKL